MNLSIVVVSWRSRDFLRRCLTSLRTAVPGAECIVIENGSRDGTAEMVLRRFPGVRLVDSPGNLGYAGGCNRGLAEMAVATTVLSKLQTFIKGLG